MKNGPFATIILSVALAVCGSASAQRATDSQMANEALKAATGSSNPERIEAVQQQGRRSVEELADGPERESDFYAAIVFETGQTAVEIEQFADTFSVELFTAEAKFPMGDDGQVMTMSTGVSMLDGTLSERLRLGMGSMQFQMRNTALQLEDNERALLLEVANVREPLYYRINVVGPASGLNRAKNSSVIAAIVVDLSGEKLSGVRAAQAQAEVMRQFRSAPVIRPLEDGPPPGVTPDRIIPNPFF